MLAGPWQYLIKYILRVAVTNQFFFYLYRHIILCAKNIVVEGERAGVQVKAPGIVFPRHEKQVIYAII